MRPPLVRVCVFSFWLVAGAGWSQAGELVILPGDVSLFGPEARQTLVVERLRGGTLVGQVKDKLAFESSNPKVVVVEQGVARAVGAGEATITVRQDNESAMVKARVTGFDKPFVWSFRNHVQSVLAKTGCSTGACHGALAGKAGFKLSLFGFDAPGDYQSITRSARGRRIVPSDPARSLLLTKPTGALPHKGGVRFSTESLEYRILADWIASGMPEPVAEDARIVRIELLPGATRLEPGMKQQLLVQAHFTDGHVEEVTRWVRYTSTNESVAKVDDRGLVSVIGYGEGAITAWYLSKVVTATITAPYKQEVPSELFAAAPKRNFIDQLVLDKLQALNIPPSPPATDEEFIRRAYLDTIGVLPKADETTKFLADKGADKRDRLIDDLLRRPEWVDYWTYKWSDLLLVNSVKLGVRAADTSSAPMWAFYTWIRNHVEANTPWDVMVRDLVTAKGNTLENGGANFFVLHKDALDMAETTTVAFLGMSINCARCHNHPLEKWSNNQYYAMANLYARVRMKLAADGGQTIFTVPEGDLIQPLTGKPQPPTPLDGQPLKFDDPSDRREALARWLTAPENPYFARSITNRIWANFFGTGLVEMVDDMRLTNPASNEQLLTAASGYLAQNKFDLKSLMRLILQSQTYQRSSQSVAANAQDKRFYSHYYPRRLMAEVLLDSISQVTEEPSEFKGYPPGWRALQLPDASVESYFLQTFGRPDREVTCDCERTAQPSMVQVLHIANGKTLNGKLEKKGNIVDRWLTSKTSAEQIVDQLYLSALARRPTDHERTGILQVLAETKDAERRATLEDLCWGVLSSREFLFNH